MRGKKLLSALLIGLGLTAGLGFGNVEAVEKPAPIQVVETTNDFHSARIDSNIVRIRDGAGDLMYLVEGKKYAALIDTGVGVGDLKSYVERMTDKPIVVILTHAHVDHASGTAQFDDVFMNQKDRFLYVQHTMMNNRVGYVEACNPVWAQSLTERNYQPEDNPARFNDMSEGTTFDLGGVHLDIYDLPGHTQGSSAVLIRENRALLTGDGANMFTFLFSDETLGLTSYKESLIRLKKVTQGKFDKIYCSHGSGDLTVDYLDRLIEDCDIILSGQDDKVPFDFMGSHANIAFEIDPAHNRIDAGIGNIVYNPNRIHE